MVTKTADIICGKAIQVHFSSSVQYIMNSIALSFIVRTQETERMKEKSDYW
jgi:hypothetical protein